MASENDHAAPTDKLGPRPTSTDTALPHNQDPYPGMLLKARYLIERELKRGGIGIVYLARDTQLLSKFVVIKALQEEVEESEQKAWIRKKFWQEIEALARINHPGVVSVLDTGQMPDGRPYFVMQYVEGVNLRLSMKAQGMDFDRAARIIRQIGQALSAAHEKGVFHRDLKPENIMIQTQAEGEEHVTLVDFGIATVRDSQVAGNSQTTKISGTIPYMAPEQLRGRPVEASDVYGLGVIAYEMLTGQVPFNANTLLQLFELQRAGVAVKPSELRPSLPEAAQAAILQALSFEPQARPPRARDLGEQLAQALTAKSAPASNLPAALTGTASSSASPEVAHTLVMGLTGTETLPGQPPHLQRLLETVLRTPAFRRAPEQDRLLLPMEDELALVFFRDLAGLTRCALEMSRALQDHPGWRLQAGVSEGLVSRAGNLQANLQLGGSGIGLAQAVMRCGDPDHILLTQAAAEALSQDESWAKFLGDLGEHEIKPGLRERLFNLFTGECGNPQPPEKLQRQTQAEALPPGRPESPRPDPRQSPKRKVAGAGLALFGLFVVGIIAAGFLLAPKVYSWLNPPSAAPAATAAAEPEPERMVSYSMEVRKYRDGRPYGRPFPYLPSSKMIFEKDYEIRLNVTSPQAGYFYLLNQGTTGAAGLPAFNVVFPTLVENQGSALVAAGERLQIEMSFDRKEGTETLWLVWAAQMAPELEAVKKWANVRDRGRVKDAEQINALLKFLSARSAADSEERPEVINDEERKLMNVRGRSNIFVSRIQLEHQ